MRADYRRFENLAESHEDTVRRAVRVELVIEYIGTACLVFCVGAGIVVGSGAVAALFALAALAGVLRAVPVNWFNPSPTPWWSRVLALVLTTIGVYITLRLALFTVDSGEWVALVVVACMAIVWVSMVHIEADHRREAEANRRLATNLRSPMPR